MRLVAIRFHRKSTAQRRNRLHRSLTVQEHLADGCQHIGVVGSDEQRCHQLGERIVEPVGRHKSRGELAPQRRIVGTQSDGMPERVDRGVQVPFDLSQPCDSHVQRVAARQ